MQIKNKKINILDGKSLKVGIVVARFNQDITDSLLKSAHEMLAQCGVKAGNIRVVSVAGAVEMPYALKLLARSKKYDFLVALGCVIRGETPHFEYVCKMAQEGVLRVMLDENIPIGFGVLTMNNIKQAEARFYVGGEAALAAIELSLLK